MKLSAFPFLLLFLHFAQLLSSALPSSSFSLLTNCISCRFIFENILESLGPSNRNQILAAEAFQSQCKMAPEVFYQACDQMMEMLQGMLKMLEEGK
jgi:hypothetical protein